MCVCVVAVWGSTGGTEKLVRKQNPPQDLIKAAETFSVLIFVSLLSVRKQSPARDDSGVRNGTDVTAHMLIQSQTCYFRTMLVGLVAVMNVREKHRSRPQSQMYASVG